MLSLSSFIRNFCIIFIYCIFIFQKEEEEDEDPELARYLNRSYWEKRQAEEKAVKKESSPIHIRSSPGGPPSAPTTPTHQLVRNLKFENDELFNFFFFSTSY